MQSEQSERVASMYTVKEVAARLRISPAAAYELVNSHKLSCYRIGAGRGTIRVSSEDLEAYLEGCRQHEEPSYRFPFKPRPRLKHLRQT